MDALIDLCSAILIGLGFAATEFNEIARRSRLQRAIQNQKCFYFSGHASAVPYDIGPFADVSVADIHGFITTRQLSDRLWWFGCRFFGILRFFFSRFF